MQDIDVGQAIVGGRRAEPADGPLQPCVDALGRRPGGVQVAGAEGAEQLGDGPDLLDLVLVSTGWVTSRRLCVPAWRLSSTSGPIIDDLVLMTSSSRIGSIGGLRTWAKFCLK